MKKYILYSHAGSANHGCEALVRTTANCLSCCKKDIVLLSLRPNEDYFYGIDEVCTIVGDNSVPANRKSISFLQAYSQYRLKHDDSFLEGLQAISASECKRGDIAISIGGDNYCYGSTSWIANRNKALKLIGVKTVLWGCSIEPELLKSPLIYEDIKSFDLITARESISFEAIKEVNPNTILVSDSAFSLETGKVSLPLCFSSNDVIGINLSPLIETRESIPGLTRKNYIQLIEYILSETTYNILLIPHVVSEGKSDIDAMRDLLEKYKESGRVFLVSDCNCKDLKGYISKCRFFIGARTHATIAAYSHCIPTIVIGYSVKSKGIATDLFGTYDNYVIPVQSLNQPNQLVKSFKWLEENEQIIKKSLLEIIPSYTSRLNNGINAIKKL